MRTIADLKNNENFTVKKVMVAKEIGKRLSDMGFTRGAHGSVVRCALLKDPLQVIICDYSVSLRRSEAGKIEVEHE